MPSVPFWQLRRLAPRAKRILERHRPQNPVLELFAASMIQRADAFMSAYDKAMAHKDTWQREVAEGEAAVRSLCDAVNGWAARVALDVPWFDRSQYGDRPDLPEDVIEDAERLVGEIHHFRHANGVPLPYREEALAVLDARLGAADKEHREAELADDAYRRLLGRVRDAATTFDDGLRLLRSHLAAIVGRTHDDYQQLRPERAGLAYGGD